MDRFSLLYQIKEFDPYYAGCFVEFDKVMGDEDEFSNCYDFFSGIGDKTWWIDSELEKLNLNQLQKLLFCLKRNQWINEKIITSDVVKHFSKMLGCETFHIYRMGNRPIYELIKYKMKSFYHLQKIKKLPEINEITEEHFNISYEECFKEFVTENKKESEVFVDFFNLNDKSDIENAKDLLE